MVTALRPSSFDRVTLIPFPYIKVYGQELKLHSQMQLTPFPSRINK